MKVYKVTVLIQPILYSILATKTARFNQQKREQNRRSNDDDGDFGGS